MRPEVVSFQIPARGDVEAAASRCSAFSAPSAVRTPLGPNQVVAHAGEGFDAYAAPVVSIPIPASRARTIASAREVAPIFQKMFVT